MAELVYWLVLGSQVSSLMLRRGEVCGDSPGDWLGEYGWYLWEALPLKLYFRFPPQGELEREPRGAVQLSSVTLVRGDPVGDWRGEAPSVPDNNEEVPLGETHGDCHGEFCGELS